ncbi:MAG: CDGSH iron-sulfur domain-containing protein [Anaerolineae bacterium]
MASQPMRITVSENGPYLVEGGIPISKQIIGTNDAGESVEWVEGESLPSRPRYRLCRCGHSGHKPFCDGTHATIDFDGTETASREPYLKEAAVFDGPGLVMRDWTVLCTEARFCDPCGSVWDEIDETGDPGVAEQVKRQVCNCPSGRLVVYDKTTGEAIEPDLPRSIGVVEDPQAGVSGPLWVRGGIQIVSFDGYEYEVRNRVTLCRCGQSKNKPFCDGTHVTVGFRDDQ